MSPNFSGDEVETGDVLFGSRTVKNRLFVRNRGDTSKPQRESTVEFVTSVEGVCVATVRNSKKGLKVSPQALNQLCTLNKPRKGGGTRGETKAILLSFFNNNFDR